MKKILLIVISILCFTITDAQEKSKANHNTTRSNKTSGVMGREDIKPNEELPPVIVGFGCDDGVFTTVSVDGSSINLDTYEYIPCWGSWAYIFATPADLDDTNEETENHVELYERIKKFTKEDFAKAKRVKIKLEKGQNTKELYKWIELLIIRQNTSGGPNTALGYQALRMGTDGLDDDCDAVTDIEMFVKKTKNDTPDLNMHCCQIDKKSWEDATRKAVKEASKAHAKKHVFMKDGVRYYYKGDLGKLNKCKTQLKENKWIEIENYNSRNANEKRKKRNKNFNRKGVRIKRTSF